MILPRLTPLLLPLSFLPLHAEEPQPEPAARVYITSASREQLNFSLINGTHSTLGFGDPWPSDPLSSVISHTTDGLFHIYRYQTPEGTPPPVAEFPHEWTFVPVAPEGKATASLPLDAANWPDLAADWPRMDGIAFSFYQPDAEGFSRIHPPGTYPALINFASSKPFPLKPAAEAPATEESKLRIEIASINPDEIVVILHNDSGRDASLFKTTNFRGDLSFMIVAEMKDGTLQRFN